MYIRVIKQCEQMLGTICDVFVLLPSKLETDGYISLGKGKEMIPSTIFL